MNIFNKHTSLKLLLISFVGAVFIQYPDIVCIPWYLDFLKGTERDVFIWVMIIRSFYFIALIFMLVRINLLWLNKSSFMRRFWHNIWISLIAFGICIIVSRLYYPKAIHLGVSILLFQFFVVFMLSTFTGHIYQQYSVQRKKEQEIEQLKIENLQSRYDALTNQINPHFFFNSLNGLSALIRKKNDENTLAYINALADVFRYILQSERKGLVSLEEELAFLQVFRYMLEVRFANKLTFNIHIASEQMDLKTPALSLLPLIDNIIVHNAIDSEHKIEVTILLNDKKELVVTNPVYPKLTIPDTNGTGLKNLENRFMLLINKQIRIENDGNMFSVFLPLN